MEQDIFKYSALTTKIRGMLKKILSYKDYDILLNKTSLGDVFSFLKSHEVYKNALSNLNNYDANRSSLERALKESVAYEVIKLIKTAPNEIKPFLKTLFKSYEIEGLKILIRTLKDHHSTVDAPTAFRILNDYSKLDFKVLSECQTMYDFIKNLSGTEYYQVLAIFSHDSNIDLFKVEMSLDLYYFRSLWKRAKKTLEKHDFDIVKKTIGTQIDILNIIWIYRAKKFYNFPKEVIIPYIIPYHNTLSPKLVLDMAVAKNIDEFLDMTRSKFPDIFKGPDFNEKDVYFSMRRSFYRYLRKYSFSVSSPIGYIYLKEYEIDNLIHIIEGIRYDLPAEKIKEYILL